LVQLSPVLVLSALLRRYTKLAPLQLQLQLQLQTSWLAGPPSANQNSLQVMQSCTFCRVKRAEMVKLSIERKMR
jgi:hypothetical protein